MLRFNLVAASALLVIGWQGAARAADLEYGAVIVCNANESRSLTNADTYKGDKKALKINSWFSNWLFNDDNYSKTTTVRFDWTPWTINGPSLKIMSDDAPHNSIRIMSRTKDSLIAVTSASDPMTAEGWLFTLNFRQEAVIGTQIQTNVGGVKGKVIVYDCVFNDKSPAIKAPEPEDTNEPQDGVG